MKLSELLYDIEYESTDNTDNIEVNKITSNANDIDSDTLFVLVKGIKFNTETIIEYIIEKHPCAILCDNGRHIETDIPVIHVENARAALSVLCYRFHGIDQVKTKFIAVTGTNGKTTTATMIYEILKFAGIKVGFIGTGKIEFLGRVISDKMYSMTTPPPELLYKKIREMQDGGCEAIVMEVSSHALALNRVAPIRFCYSVFTNLSDEHMDFHKDTEEYYYTKLRLFTQSENGIFNADDEYSARAMRECFDLCNTMSVGILWDAETMARDVILNDLESSSYIYREDRLIFKVKLSLGGYYNIYNSLLALKCAIAFGIRPCVAKEAINNIKRIDGRLEIIRDGVCVIIDYAHTEKAFENILKTVKSSKRSWQKIITVFGCGGDRDKIKRPKMASVAERFSDLVIVTQDNSRTENESDIISDILSGFSDISKRKIIVSRKQAIKQAITSADDGDIVLILGKGHERYNIDKDGYHEFDEREIIAEALKRRKAVASKK